MKYTADESVLESKQSFPANVSCLNAYGNQDFVNFNFAFLHLKFWIYFIRNKYISRPINVNVPLRANTHLGLLKLPLQLYTFSSQQMSYLTQCRRERPRAPEKSPLSRSRNALERPNFGSHSTFGFTLFYP